MSWSLILKNVTMRPSRKYEKVLHVARLCARLCGADVADVNYKMNIITYLTCTSIVVYFLFTLYTVKEQIHENWGTLLQSFCMVGSVIQGATKLAVGIIHAKFFSRASSFLMSVYEINEAKGQHYQDVLDRCITRVQFVLKLAALIYAVIVPSFVAMPLVVWAATGRRTLAMQFLIPYLDIETTFGYIITLCSQIFCLIFGAFGNFAGEGFILILFGHMSLFADILKVKVDELNVLAVDLGAPIVTEKLQDLISWHQSYTQYVEHSERFTFWVNFMQISTSAVSIVFTLFIMITGGWLGSYGYCLLVTLIMYMYCVLGTLVEVANDEITSFIYEIHWYNLTISQQKTVGLMLMKSQTPKEISIGGVAPMSVNTALQVTKSIYSIFMMIMNFVE